jgi:hypothetical protein
MTEVSTTQKQVRRRVIFSEAHNTVHMIEEEFDLVVEECWYVGGDYMHMKSSSRIEAKEWRRQGYGIILKETFERPRPDAQDFINAFVLQEGAQSRRGLERHLSRQHGEERSALKDQSRQCVLIHQHRLKKKGVKQYDMMEHIGKAYKDTCRTARVFARRMAKADELVANEGTDSSHAERIVQDFHEKATHCKMERRLSNFSIQSGNSFDSNRAWGVRTSRASKCPPSPAGPAEEYYAAIA